MVSFQWDPNVGEIVKFCCSQLEAFYRKKYLAWDPGDRKYAIRFYRYTKQDNAGVVKQGIVEGVQDLVTITYCPFCSVKLVDND